MASGSDCWPLGWMVMMNDEQRVRDTLAGEAAGVELGKGPDLGSAPTEEPDEEAQDGTGEDEASARSPGSFVREMVVLFAVALTIALLIKTFVVQPFFIPSASMEDTLLIGDKVLVNKLVYRATDPQLGDVVMMQYPLNPDKVFAKRIIAREGDTVRIVDGGVSVNGVPVHENYVPAAFRSHDDFGPIVVPQGDYFVLGDHRNNSSDSRHWGFVPKKYILGKITLSR